MNENEKYVPSEESLKFIAFIRACGIEDNISPEVHYRLADAFFSENKKDRKVLIECVRGLGKSTLMEYLVLYIAVIEKLPGFGPIDFIAFLGDSQDGNVKNFFRNLRTKIENSEFLQGLLTIQRSTDKEMELLSSGGKELDISGKGMSTNIRGIRYKGKRIDLLICDDVTTNEAMTSDVIQQTIDVNYFNSALPALHPTRHKVFYICTPISERDLATKLKTSGAYRVEKYPLCSKFPCIEEDYDSIWEDRFPYEYAEEMYNQMKSAGKAQTFYQEYLLQITDLSTLLVHEEDIRWFDPKIIGENMSGYNFYIATDFAVSQKKSADYSVITVFGVSNNGDWLVVDGQCVRKSITDTMNDLFKYVRKWKPLSVGIETSGQQGGFISILEEKMLRENTWFNLAKKRGSNVIGIRPTSDKLSRFVTGVQSKFKQGKVWLPRPEHIVGTTLEFLVEELTDELSKLTLAAGTRSLKHDDVLDTLNQLSEMDIVVKDADVNIWGRVDYDDEDSGSVSCVF